MDWFALPGFYRKRDHHSERGDGEDEASDARHAADHAKDRCNDKDSKLGRKALCRVKADLRLLLRHDKQLNRPGDQPNMKGQIRQGDHKLFGHSESRDRPVRCSIHR